VSWPRVRFPHDEPESLSPADSKLIPLVATDVILALEVKCLTALSTATRGSCHRTIFEDVLVVAAALTARKSAAAISSTSNGVARVDSNISNRTLFRISDLRQTATRVAIWGDDSEFRRVARTCGALW